MKHTIVHFEIPADNVERAKEFYGELCGWQFSSPPGFEHYLDATRNLSRCEPSKSSSRAVACAHRC